MSSIVNEMKKKYGPYTGSPTRFHTVFDSLRCKWHDYSLTENIRDIRSILNYLSRSKTI